MHATGCAPHTMFAFVFVVGAQHFVGGMADPLHMLHSLVTRLSYARGLHTWAELC